MKLYNILKKCNTVFTIINPQNFDISGLTYDSKCVKNNFIFSCIQGKNFCGTKFIKDLIHYKKITILTKSQTKGLKSLNNEFKKKITLIVSKDVKKLSNEILNILHPNKFREKIAVTGTNGKTSVTDYTRQIWHKKKINCASFGTLGVLFKDKQIIKSGLTTFEPEIFFKSINKLSNLGCEKLILEASSIGIDQDRIYPLRFDKIGFTNLTHDHMDYHKTFRNYKIAKSKLFKNFSHKSTIAVLNSDDKYFEYFKKICIKKRIAVLDYGFKANFLKITNIQIVQDSIILKLKIKKSQVKLVLKKISLFDIYNRLCSIILVHGEKLSKTKLQILNKLTSPKGRLEKVYDKQFTVYVDYAHTPDAIKKVLESLKKIEKKNIISLIGCGGDRDFKKRPLMTQIASRFSKIVILADDNPRNEDPLKIRNEMMSKIKKRNKILNIGDRETAIKEGINIIKKNEIFIIFGKGHEEYQLIRDKKIPFSDSKMVLKILKRK